MQMLLTVLGAILTAITLPLILELFAVTSAFWFARKQPLRALSSVPRLTVVVPAHDEEGLIQSCVNSLVRSAQGAARVLVVAHNCSDATGERASQAGAAVLVFNDIEAKGKGQALRHGFQRAIEDGAEAVLVVDADSVVSENLVPEVLKRLSQGATAIQCRYEMLSPDNSARGHLASLAFRAFCYIRPAGRDRLGLSAGISGNGFALSAKLLNKVPYDAFSVVEDLEYHIHAVMAGENVRFLQSAVVSSYFPVSSSGEASQQSRWQGGRLGVAKKYLPSLLGRILTGQLRLIEPALDLAGLPIAFGVAALLLEALVPLHWVHLYVFFSLCVVLAHVITAACAGPSPAASLRFLAMAPFYILRKFTSLPKTLKTSSKEAEWIRTDRETPMASQPDQGAL